MTTYILELANDRIARELPSNAASVTPADIQAMREWASDCHWLDSDDLPAMTDAEIVQGIGRHYEGGVYEFLKTVR